jgi:hypothetical protein
MAFHYGKEEPDARDLAVLAEPHRSIDPLRTIAFTPDRKGAELFTMEELPCQCGYFI